MGNIKDEANQYEPKSKVKNISELQYVDLTNAVIDEPNAEYPYKYMEIDGERYKIPVSVLASLKEMIKEKPDMKQFKVTKSGKDLETKYTVIPL